MLKPFSFQIEHKQMGCEDAPPVASVDYSIVCDGLGGSGLTKYELPSDDGEKTISRTGAYIGARVVCDCVTDYFEKNQFSLDFHFQKNQLEKEIKDYAEGLKQKIIQALAQKKEELNVEAPRAKSLKLFPTTLASTVYFKDEEALYVLCIWAGDSRIYCLSPTEGLQLLSQDDAAESDDKMNSGTVMSNCISAENEFSLNYLVHKITEPSIIFTCSDGCFDYLPSPLNLEWIILKLILQLDPETSGQQTGEEFSNALRNDIFEQIAADDTTMCGVLYQIDTIKEMQDFFRKRMDDFGETAVLMNRTINRIKDLRAERDRLRREKGSISDEIRTAMLSEIKDAMGADEQSKLSVWIRNLDLYQPFKEKENQTHKYYVQLAEEENAKQSAKGVYKQFLDMLKLDYLKYTSEHNTQSRSSQRNQYWSSSKNVIPLLETLQNLLSMNEFYDYLNEEGQPTENLKKYGNELIGILNESITGVNQRMREMWSHAYYSRPFFQKELESLNEDEQFEKFLQGENPDVRLKSVMSSLTAKKYDEYKVEASKRKPAQIIPTETEKNELRTIRQDFISTYSEAVLDEIKKLSEKEQKSILLLKGVSEEQLSKCSAYDSNIMNIETEIKQLQQKADEIWDQYRTNYERFRKGKMRGNI